MLTPEQIQFEIDSIIKKNKSFEFDSKRPGNKHTRPEYYHGYNDLCDQYDSISVHSEMGKFPDKLFSERSPNQQPEEFEYIKKNYKQTTLPVFIDYINQLKRSFNDGNWNIDYKDQDDFREYVESEFPVYGSVEQFEKEVLPVIKSKDPMGMISIRPIEIPLVKDNEGNVVLNNEGQPMVDDAALISPAINYFNITQLVSFDEDKWYIFKSKHKSVVQFGGSNIKDGLIFEAYDEKNIWIIRQVGKKNDFTFQISLFYSHNLGKVPARRLKGIPVIKEDHAIFQSPFIYAVGLLDLVLLNSSNLQMSINHCVYPVRIMIGNECDFQDSEGNRCGDGYINYTSDQGLLTKTCPSCNGSGLRTRISPLGTILLKPAGRDNPNGEVSPDGAFKYISPELSSLEFLMKKIQDDESRARAIAHIYNTNTKAQGSDGETATGRYIDQKSLYAFIKPISDEMFQTWEWIYDIVGTMRFGDSFENPEFTYPKTFEFLTEDDYIEQIKSAMDAGMPPSVIFPLINRFLQTLFYTEAETSMAFILICNADRLLTQSEQQIQAGLINGTVEKWEKILHDSAFFFVKELTMEDPKFFDQSLEDQKLKLIDKAKIKAAEVPSQNGDAVNSLIPADI